MTNQTSNPSPEQLNDPEGQQLVQTIHDRKELTGTLANTICNASNYPNRAQPHLLGGDMTEVLNKTADSLLVAGYRKPRTITTAEELDVLPVGSVVLHNGRSFQRYDPCTLGHYEYNLWQCSDGGFVRTREAGRLIVPATVLHTPEAAK